MSFLVSLSSEFHIPNGKSSCSSYSPKFLRHLLIISLCSLAHGFRHTVHSANATIAQVGTHGFTMHSSNSTIALHGWALDDNLGDNERHKAADTNGKPISNLELG